MGHGYRPDIFRRINKKKLVIAVVIIGVVMLLVILAVIAIIIAVVSALLGQADSSIGQSIGNIISISWKYAMDFFNALWQQVIANPLEFLTGGNG